MSDGVLRVSSLSGGYSRALAIRDVTLDIQPGEIVALFGANGAGKSTLLRGLLGSLPHCTGRVELAGERIDGLKTWHRARLGLAHVPEGRHLFGSMSVRDNLELGAVAAQSKPSIDAVFELFPKLAERRAQDVATLSGGEQQMVAIGRALMSAPKVMVIDEMSAGLAPVITERLVDGLRKVRGSGVAMLLVEQAPQFVADLIDRAYLLDRGAIVNQGTLAELGGSAGIAEMYLGVR